MKINVAREKLKNNDIKAIAKKYNINERVAALLLGRGVDETVIRSLTSDIQILPQSNNITNAEEAAYLIANYLQNDNAEIFIYADYDSDGVNAGFISYDCLSKLVEGLESKCKINVHFPNRTAGYGLNIDWCKEVVDYKNSTNKNILVMTVDNGITKHREVEYLLTSGIDDVLITDHHVPKVGEVPEDVIIVNPHLYPQDDKQSLGLCGTGVIFKICDYLLREIYQDDSNYNLIYLPHVAIATITDMMPLTTENIQYVKYGLRLIEQDYCVKGISHYKHFKGKSNLTTKDIAFGLGPELNACGRMLQTEVAGSFLLSDNEDEIEDIYCLVDKINKDRKAYQKELTETMLQNVMVSSQGKFAIAILPEVGGVGGVLAAKLIEALGVPCMVLSGEGDLLHGSARSVRGVDLHALFSHQVRIGNMLDFGGHEGAAGVHVDKKKIKALLDSLDACIEFVEVDGDMEQEITVDEVITLKEVTKTTAEIFKDIPFIDSLKEPIYAVKDLEVKATSVSKNNQENICFTVTDGTKEMKIWAWGYASTYEALGSPKRIHMIGSVEPNFMNPRQYTLSVQQIIDAA